MRASSVVLGLALLVPAAANAANVRLTIVSAKLDGKAATASDHMSTASLSDLACLSLPGLREIAGMCGGADPTANQKRPNVDPLVRVEIGDRVIRTYPVPGTLTPKWEYGVILDKAFLDSDDYADFILYDYDGPGAEKKIGHKLVKARDLMKAGVKTLTGLGGATLTYRVDVLPDSTGPRNYAFRVPADQQMADLARNAKTSGPGYVVIPVAEGEQVEVSATGKVLPNAKKHPDRIAGPNGIPVLKTKIQFNQPGFRTPDINHAALIGQIGSTGMMVGEHKTFTVENAGLLVLAVNDVKVSDNEGFFDVKVTVTLPAATATARAPSKTKGSAADSGPSGIDPRVIQQAVDAHGPELDACAAAAANPYGELVLAFTISADGSPLGVIIEKASPNLKEAGECMRKKALAWRFPPPHGVVSARYPISYSPG